MLDPQGEAIHRRILVGDAAAWAVAFEAYYPSLVRELLARHRPADPQLAEEAAAQAFEAYFRAPEKYDPARRGLRGYLTMAANGDLINLLARERRHRAVLSLDRVELDDLPRNNPVEEALEMMAADETATQLWRDAMTAALTPGEQRVLELMRDGVRATGDYAAALGLAHLPLPEQRRAVKQAKDRLKRRVERRGLARGAGAPAASRDPASSAGNA